MKATEMRTLKWMCGMTKLDKIKNKYITESLRVTNVAGKTNEYRLKWIGDILRENIMTS